jgi:structure-specific endonuclease subunit SLX1
MYVYLIQSTRGKTYVGATINVARRLRQHNAELVGGAKYTTRAVQKGESWNLVCYVSGFEDWRAVLQFEWKWKDLTRRLPPTNVLQKRLEALNLLIAQGFSTSTSSAFENLVIHEKLNTKPVLGVRQPDQQIHREEEHVPVGHPTPHG